MKRLPIVIIGAGLLAAACSTAPAGSLGPAPAGAAHSVSAAPSRPGTPSSGQPSGQLPTREISLQVWFARDGKLFSTERTIPATPGVGQAALDRMLAGPSAAEVAAGLSSQFPQVTGVRFELGGQRVTSIGGMPVQALQTRAMYASYLPAITVQSPVIG